MNFVDAARYFYGSWGEGGGVVKGRTACAQRCSNGWLVSGMLVLVGCGCSARFV